MKLCSRCKTEPSAGTGPYCRPCRRAYEKSRRRPKPTMAERFWAKVRKEDFERDPGLGPCWIWTGSINTQSGYGMFMTGDRTSPGGHREPTQAHIVSARLAGKVCPEGKEWDHFCRQRPCVNPPHLEAVTHPENIRRGMSIVADYMEAGSFKCGHAKDSEHAYARPDGKGVQCGTCGRDRARKHYRDANQAKRRAEDALQQVPF